MSKVRDLNFLLEFGQKNLHGIRPNTELMYRRTLGLMLNKSKVKRPLWMYQEGIKAVVDQIKRFKEGTYDEESRRNEYQVTKTGSLLSKTKLSVYARYTGTPQDLGKMLVCDLLSYGNLQLDRDDFAYCLHCEGIYAKKSKKSRFCTHLCNVKFNTAEKAKTLEE